MGSPSRLPVPRDHWVPGAVGADSTTVEGQHGSVRDQDDGSTRDLPCVPRGACTSDRSRPRRHRVR